MSAQSSLTLVNQAQGIWRCDRHAQERCHCQGGYGGIAQAQMWREIDDMWNDSAKKAIFTHSRREEKVVEVGK